MDRKAKKMSPQQKETQTKGRTKRKFVTIDVQCKQFTMIFPKDFHQPSKKRTTNRGRSVKWKPKPAEASTKPSSMKTQTAQVSKKASSNSAEQQLINKNTKLSMKKSEILGSLNIGNGSSLEAKNDTKREKRKRLAGEEIAAENIPLDAIFPTMQFGINKDICPKKRRRLQSLISPHSPRKFFPCLYNN